MSRSWLERWRIGLAPQCVDALRLGWAGGAGAPRTADCASTPGTAPWQAAVDALGPLLATAGAPPRWGGSACVVLSNHFVRYTVLPWQPAIQGQRELSALARHRFGVVFGDAAAAWTLRVAEGGWGLPSVACAVDTALLDALRAALAQRRLRLAGVQPLLMAAYNGGRRRLAADAAFALIEPGRVCIGMLADGGFEAVVSRRSGSDPALAVEQELATLRPQAGAAAPLVLLRVGAAAPWLGVRVVDEWPATALAACGVG